MNERKGRIIDANTETLETNGAVVTWDPPGEVKYSEVCKALEISQLPPVAKELVPRTAFNRAVKKLKDDKIITKVEEDHETTTFQFTATSIRNNGYEPEMDFQKICILTLEKTTGRIKCENEEIRQAVQEKFNEAIEIRTGGDVTAVIRKVMEHYGSDLIPLRRCGGVYYIPKRMDFVIERLSTFFRQLGGTLNVLVVPKADEKSKETIAQRTRDYIRQMIQELEDSIKDITPESRPCVSRNRLERTLEIHRKIQLYRNLLSSYTDELDEVYKKTSEELRKAIVKNQGESILEKVSIDAKTEFENHIKSISPIPSQFNQVQNTELKTNTELETNAFGAAEENVKSTSEGANGNSPKTFGEDLKNNDNPEYTTENEKENENIKDGTQNVKDYVEELDFTF